METSMEFKEWLNQEPETKIYESPNSIEVSYSDPNVKGYIHAEKDPENNEIYRVNRVDVTPKGQGYGKKLYEIALSLATKRGVMLAPAKKYTSDSALNIWRSLYKSNVVEKIPFPAKDWGIGPRNERMLNKYTNLRLSDSSTHPPKEDIDFWSMNSGYHQK
jgi:GNAT superfamily N-acetyltransferase